VGFANDLALFSYTRRAGHDTEAMSKASQPEAPRRITAFSVQRQPYLPRVERTACRCNLPAASSRRGSAVCTADWRSHRCRWRRLDGCLADPCCAEPLVKDSSSRQGATRVRHSFRRRTASRQGSPEAATQSSDFPTLVVDGAMGTRDPTLRRSRCDMV
jgi:hypothetical protein